MEEQNVFPIEHYVDLAFRRKWLIIIPFILMLVITVVIYWRLPKIYRSDTLILVLPQKVPEEYVRATVTSPVEARLTTISEEILSRTSLESIINECELYLEKRETDPMDKIIDFMRLNIDIKVNRGSSYKSGSFRIYYQGKDPETVQRVTNKLASLFIEENLKTREQQARVTTDFLNKELERAKAKLEMQEVSITEFKFKNIGNLPEQNTANLEILSQFSIEKQSINERIVKLEENAFLIQQQLSELGKSIDSDRSNSIRLQIQAAQNELLNLLGVYKDKHIDVRKVQERIKQLEEQLISGEKGLESEATDEAHISNSGAQDLKNQLLLIQRQIERLKKDEEKIKQSIKIYEGRIEESPRVELELTALTRDYDNTKRFYENLLNKKLEAEQAENLERRQQGEQFRILDPASFPKIPFKPNPKKVFPIGVLLGFGLGCGLAFLAEKLDKSFRNEKEVEEYLGVPVLAVIPLVKKKQNSQIISA